MKNLVENFKTIFETMVKVKPAAAKGTYMKNVTVTSTMGPGVKVDPSYCCVNNIDIDKQHSIIYNHFVVINKITFVP